ncbi:MAG: hypothetical protein ABIY55_16265, partial [Kofleriaceae bacterium]
MGSLVNHPFPGATIMHAIHAASFDTSFNTSFNTSFQGIDANLLTDVNGGFDFGKMVDAGNANVASGAKAGAALVGAGGAIAGGIAGG